MQGHSGKPVGARNGRSGLQMDVLKWRAGRGFPKPHAREVQRFIPLRTNWKIVHFLMDYQVDWFSSLQLPPSTGKHNRAQIDLVLDRLETITQVLGGAQLFTAVQISHAEFKGSQIIHCIPFKQERPSKANTGTY